MTDLDAPSIYRRLDPSGLGRRIAGMAQQCRDAWAKALAFPLPYHYGSVERVLVLGMGGSAIAGDLLADLCAHLSGPPVLVHRDYELPARWASEKTLVVASSYSGNTEETLSCFRRALSTPLPGRAKLLALTSGGQLLTLAREGQVPAFTIDFEGEPRSAPAWGFLPLVAFLQRLGLIADQAKGVQEAASVLERLVAEMGPDVPTSRNPAKALAQRMHSKLAVIYGAGLLTGAARRWKTQVNENSKAWAFFEALPELHHNALVGFPHPAALRKELFVVMLRSPRLHVRTLLRYDITRDLLAETGVPHETIDAQGEGPLSQMLSTVLFGDYVSYYLAMLNGVDPSPVPVIDRVKKRLAEG
ncbi:MAG: bifunctional phosphoglucose/phosphomannose isomerase [Chloroflexi bacterium]|nr:bifunctional phosphoglucose/phosphomannose isomerase [Chloroflexota bacterium]